MLFVCSGNQRTNADLLFISPAVWNSKLYEKKWGFAGLFVAGLRAMLTQTVVRADPPRGQLQALPMNCGDHMVSSHPDGFFLESHSSSPEKVIAGLADLHPPLQVWKIGVHLQSLSIISVCIKLKHQSMHKACWLIFRAVHCPDSLPGNRLPVDFSLLYVFQSCSFSVHFFSFLLPGSCDSAIH